MSIDTRSLVSSHENATSTNNKQQMHLNQQHAGLKKLRVNCGTYKKTETVLKTYNDDRFTVLGTQCSESLRCLFHVPSYK